MIIYKFGGASVSSSSSIRKLTSIVSTGRGRMGIIISAFGKTTNMLEDLLDWWYEDNPRRFIILEHLIKYHYRIIRDLIPSDQDPVYSEFTEIVRTLKNKINSVPSPDYDFEYDQLVSFGEIVSTRIVSAFLNCINIRNTWLDARTWLITDNQHRDANVDMTVSGVKLRNLIHSTSQDLWITQGFIGGTADGVTTTLGREGSDYTAAIAANLLDARKVVVWKDVPGILTADPSYFPEAEKIDELSYREAIELSFYGAKVIHPKTIKPLQNKNIPLYVKSFVKPRDPGTLIHSPGSFIEIKPILIIKKEQVLISLIPNDFSFVVEDYFSRIFTIFFKLRIKVNLIQHSAISFTICIDNGGTSVRKLLSLLREDFQVLYNENLELITIRHYKSEIIDKYTAGKEILVEQRSRSTAMFVVR
jgi:aspartate kinase